MDETKDDYFWDECKDEENEEEAIHLHGTLMNMCLKNNGKNCLEVKMKTILKDDRCCSACKAQLTSVVLSLQVKPTKNFVPFFEPKLGGCDLY